MGKFVNYANSANIINIQHFSVDDGPGIRTTVFLKGCPLRCAWCHNPETHRGATELMYRADKCRLCGACQVACPQGLHRVENDAHVFDRNENFSELEGGISERERGVFECVGCLVCGRCSEVCVFGALELVGQKMTVEEVVSEIMTDSQFCKLSGGGVTISGGEPLAQAEFTEALLLACKKHELHTCVETCGYGSIEKLLEMAKYTDLFLFDYKLTDDEKHRAFTGVSNQLILKNLDALCRNGAEVILRCPMIPEVNVDVDFDGDGDGERFDAGHFDAIAELANRYPMNIKEIHLEPYHPLGVAKVEYLGKVAEYKRDTFLEREDLEFARTYVQGKVRIPVKIS